MLLLMCKLVRDPRKHKCGAEPIKGICCRSCSRYDVCRDNGRACLNHPLRCGQALSASAYEECLKGFNGRSKA